MLFHKKKLILTSFIILLVPYVSLFAQDPTPTPTVSSCTYSDYGIFSGPDSFRETIEARIRFYSDLADIIDIQTNNPDLYNDPPTFEFDIAEYFNLNPRYEFYQESSFEDFFEQGQADIDFDFPIIQLVPGDSIQAGSGFPLPDGRIGIPQGIQPLPSEDLYSEFSGLFSESQIQTEANIEGSAALNFPENQAIAAAQAFLENPDNERLQNEIIVGFPLQQEPINGPGVNELDAYLRSLNFDITTSDEFDPDNPDIPLFEDLVNLGLPSQILESLFERLTDGDVTFVTNTCEDSLSRDLILASHWCSIGDIGRCQQFNTAALRKTSADGQDLELLVDILFDVYGQIVGNYHTAESCVHFWSWIRLGTINDLDPNDEKVVFPTQDPNLSFMLVVDPNPNSPADLETAAKRCGRDLEAELSELTRISEL